jgi:hypothetical protein
MSDLLTPSLLLAAALRVVVPEAAIRHDPQWRGWKRGRWATFGTDIVRVHRVHEDGTNWWANDDHEDERNECFDATSLDSLARVVAMLTPEQLDRFDEAMTRATGERTGPAYGRIYISPSPSKVIKATPIQILVAIIAAVGAEIPGLLPPPPI